MTRKRSSGMANTAVATLEVLDVEGASELVDWASDEPVDMSAFFGCAMAWKAVDWGIERGSV
jgi:hypothetical protein